MPISIIEDVRTVTDLKRNTREILEKVYEAGRPLVLTVNGKADAVIMDAKSFEKHLKTANMARLLLPAEDDAASGRTRPMRAFLKEFKNARKVLS